MLKVASLNCRGLNKKLKRNVIFNDCANNTISCLQESYINDDKRKLWELEWKGHFFHVNGSSNSNGLIILVDQHVDLDQIKVIFKKDRILCLQITFNDFTFVVANIYAPNTKKEKFEFFNDLYFLLDKVNNDNLVICGDFNMVYDNSLDIVSGEPHDKNIVSKFIKWIDTHSLIDTWRLTNKSDVDFTWCRSNPFVARRLDYIFSSEVMSHKLISSKHCINTCSDHKMVLTCFDTNIFNRGPSYWKLNASVLHDKSYIDEMNSSIDTFLAREEFISDPVINFEMLKIMVKSKSIEYCTKRNKSMKNKEYNLNLLLNSLNDKIKEGDLSLDTLQKFESTKSELEIIKLNKAKGAIVRSRAKHIEEGERNSKYFLNLEKGRGKYNTINILKNEHGDEPIKNEIDILQEIKMYHENIAKSRVESNDCDNKLNNYLKDINHPILPDHEREFCDTELTLEEVGIALSNLNNDSAPGIDGLPVSWYKVFYNKIKLPLFKCLNHCILTGTLGSSQRRAVITLIHKGKDLDRQILKNWRPISLTTTDYKFFSKCIANRLQKILPSIIHTSQSGFIKGRSIVDHIRLIDDIINLSRKKKSPGMIVSLDYQKAFDSIEKSSIISALQKFNFGSNFINLVNTLINKTESCVQNGGWLSGFFDVERGIRQGCCVSPILFIIVAELMSIKIRNNENVNGLSFNSANKVSKQIKLLQYADDTTLLLKSKDDLQNAINDVKNFSNISGLILNEQKSIGMWLGGSIERTDFPENVSWAKRGENIRILGIFFNSEIEASNIDLNWKARIQNIEKIIVKLHKQKQKLSALRLVNV